MVSTNHSSALPSLWVITEGLTGTENQCLGVAEALGIVPEVKRIGLNQPWKTLSPYIGFETETSFTGDTLQLPWPDILIASGRKSIAAARYIKRMSGGKTYTVQIQDPRLRRSEFDLVVVPEHDPGRGANVLVTAGAPNRITGEKLATARERFAPLFQHLPSPRIAVLIGGSTNTHQLNAEKMREISTQLKNLADQGKSLMITTSRRTGEESSQILRQALKDSSAYIWDGPGPQASENPYFGLLAWADAIIVTSDSMSMVSEAATTGKPVHVVSLGAGKKRHEIMMNNFIRHGYVRPFSGIIEFWQYDALHDAAKVAAEIRRKSGYFAN